MATNPYHGININGKWYHYVAGSYNKTRSFKNSSSTTQNSKTFSFNGLDLPVHSVTLVIENQSFEPYDLATNNKLGATNWVGSSRLTDLENMLGWLGNSMPLIMVNPYGATHLVVPTGSFDEQIYNPTAIPDTGAPFRVQLSFENTQ